MEVKFAEFLCDPDLGLAALTSRRLSTAILRPKMRMTDLDVLKGQHTFGTAFGETCPGITQDGKYLFLSRYNEEDGLSNVYWVSAEVINKVRSVEEKWVEPACKNKVTHTWRKLRLRQMVPIISTIHFMILNICLSSFN